MLGCHPSTLTQRSMHHQKSSSDSPFQAKTGNPGTEREMVLNPVRWALPGRAPRTTALLLAISLFVNIYLLEEASEIHWRHTHKAAERTQLYPSSFLPLPQGKALSATWEGNTVSKITFICKIKLLLQVRWPAFLLGTLSINWTKCILTHEQFVDLAVTG